MRRYAPEIGGLIIARKPGEEIILDDGKVQVIVKAGPASGGQAAVTLEAEREVLVCTAEEWFAGMRVQRSRWTGILEVSDELIIGEGESEAVIIVESASGGRMQLRVVAGSTVRIERAELCS